MSTDPFFDLFPQVGASTLGEALAQAAGDLASGKAFARRPRDPATPEPRYLVLNPHSPDDRRVAAGYQRQGIGIRWAVPLTDGAHEEV